MIILIPISLFNIKVHYCIYSTFSLKKVGSPRALLIHADVRLPGCNAVWTSSQILTFRWNILPASVLKMEAVCFPITLVSIFELTRRYNPEGEHPHRISYDVDDVTKVYIENP
jgi:hypothetical protein